MEKIGKVKIDDTYYPGEDFYCDGNIEDELLEIVKNYEPKEFQQIIEERADWPTFYHLSSQRQNIIEWLPISKNAKVLEVGSGCGAITGMLAQKAGEVHCIDLSKKRTLINANRNKMYDNITMNIGNFKDIEPHLACDYDYILLIGVFEYAKGYMGTNNPYVDFMHMLKKHLAIEGRLVIAIENQLGLKYWAGCREDHIGTYFSGLEGYIEDQGVETLTKSGLENVLKTNEVKEYSFYYPYPDYKFMTSLYSDDYLPRTGELTTNLCNYDRERLLLFDEALVYDNLIKEGLFPIFSNSFMVVTGAPLEIKYSKYSNERNDEFSIRTDILAKDEKYWVEKIALHDNALNHLNQMREAYELLKKRYAGSPLEFNEIVKVESRKIAFKYIAGETLEQCLDEYLKVDDTKGFLLLFQKYVEFISYHNEVEISNLDFIFSNILIDGDRWVVIDYEWTKQEKVNEKEIAYRGFYCYMLQGKYKREKYIELEKEIITYLQLDSHQVRNLQEKEREFQESISSKKLVKAQIQQLIANPVVTIENMGISAKLSKMEVQVYEDFGTGFKEESSYFLAPCIVGKNSVVLSVDKSVKNIRIDPSMTQCVVEIINIRWNGEDRKDLVKKLETNGYMIGLGKYFFEHTDPNLILPLKKMKKQEKNELEISYKFSGVLGG